ncbi:potassium channel family protein [Catenulispora yoronensis]|uniref:Potassium channel family protein n=1 Tax=Catenulispora yoronensis TaxID=450799 RepID=A0ABN2V8N2_9ACTN
MDDSGGPERADRRGRRLLRLPRPVRLTAAVLGPAALTTAYFTLPFGLLSTGDHVLAWLLLGGLLVLLALGMLATTIRAITDQPGYPGLWILLLSWASILTFAASYWSLAIGHGQFGGSLKTRLDALYFTGVTMATVGYGDIYPSGQAARAFVLVQIVYTFAFLAGGVTAVGSRLRSHLTRRMTR